MIEIKRAVLEEAKMITEIKTRAYNKEINTYLGRDGGPKGYNEVSSQEEIITNLIAYKIELDSKIIGAFFLIPLGYLSLFVGILIIIARVINSIRLVIKERKNN